MNGKVLSVIPKNKTTTVQTKISEWKGNTYVDVREYFKNAKDEWIPTRKGLAIPVAMLAEVLTALEKAEEDICKEKEKPVVENP